MIYLFFSTHKTEKTKTIISSLEIKKKNYKFKTYIHNDSLVLLIIKYRKINEIIRFYKQFRKMCGIL